MKLALAVLAAIALTIVVLPVGSARAARASEAFHAIVTLKDSSVVRGELMELGHEAVRLDPDGPVSLRTIPADQIATVYVRELDEFFAYPLPPDGVPADLRRGIAKTQRVRESVLRPEEPGFRMFALAAGAGITTTGFTAEDKGYYEGFGSGPNFHLGARVFFPRDDARESRLFVGLSFSHSTQRAEDPLALLEDGMGNRILVEIHSLGINRFGGELGVTTGTLGFDSYLYFLMGATVVKNTVSAEGTLISGPGAPRSAFAKVTDDRLGLRLGVGAVIGMTPRLGIELSGVMDALYAGQQSIYGFPGGTQAHYDGWLPGVNVGLSYEL